MNNSLNNNKNSNILKNPVTENPMNNNSLDNKQQLIYYQSIINKYDQQIDFMKKRLTTF